MTFEVALIVGTACILVCGIPIGRWGTEAQKWIFVLAAILMAVATAVATHRGRL